jgi:hypothetical protein
MPFTSEARPYRYPRVETVGLRSVRRQEAAMISVTVATDDTWVTCETDSGYSPEQP